MQARKAPRQPRLPQCELDPIIALPTPAERERKETFDQGVRAHVSARSSAQVTPGDGDPGQDTAAASSVRLEASHKYEQERLLRRFLSNVERDADQFVEPFPERAKAWLRIVRAQLETQSPWRSTLGERLTGPSLQPWPPRWWPGSEATEEE